jgi:hypothetical protein
MELDRMQDLNASGKLKSKISGLVLKVKGELSKKDTSNKSTIDNPNLSTNTDKSVSLTPQEETGGHKKIIIIGSVVIGIGLTIFIIYKLKH